MKHLLSIAAVVLVLFLLFAVWFCFAPVRTADVRALRTFLPETAASRAEVCGSERHPLLASADLGALIPILQVSDDHIAAQIARDMMAETREPTFKRLLRELRLTAQIQLRYSPREQATIYLNRGYFGEGQYGAEEAAKHYFGVEAPRLSRSQAALLIVLTRAPALYSPSKHPERALDRRNNLLEVERQRGMLSDAEASEAKAAGLGL